MENATSPIADRDTNPKRKLRWYQYSLRTLLILVTVFAFVCSWVAVKMGQAKRQKEIVEQLIKSGCGIRYDFEVASFRKNNSNPQPPATAWLRGLLGIDFFSNVEEVYCENNLTDDDLKKLGEFKHLKVLEIYNSPITDAGFEHLKQLTQLKTLRLFKTQITDAGLKNLAGMTQLEKIDLREDSISDAGLAHLAGLTKTKTLLLRSGKITDAGIAHLSKMSELEWLTLRDTEFSDAGLSEIKKFTKLDYLDIGGTKISDAGLTNLKTLPKLNGLVLPSTISKDGMKELKDCFPAITIGQTSRMEEPVRPNNNN